MYAHVIDEHRTAVRRSAAGGVRKELYLDCLTAVVSKTDSSGSEVARIRRYIAGGVISALIGKCTAVRRNLYNQIIAGDSHVGIVEGQLIVSTIIGNINRRRID